jgi:hypothetical protein
MGSVIDFVQAPAAVRTDRRKMGVLSFDGFQYTLVAFFPRWVEKNGAA